MLKHYDMSFLYHPGKVNFNTDALSRMTINCVYHIDEAKKVLVKVVHRFTCLGVRLEDSRDGGLMVHNNSDSWLVAEVKSKQHLHKSMMDFKETVLVKLNESFSLGIW